MKTGTFCTFGNMQPDNYFMLVATRAPFITAKDGTILRKIDPIRIETNGNGIFTSNAQAALVDTHLLKSKDKPNRPGYYERLISPEQPVILVAI